MHILILSESVVFFTNRLAPVKVAPERDIVCTTFFDQKDEFGVSNKFFAQTFTRSRQGNLHAGCIVPRRVVSVVGGCAGSMRAGGLAGVGDDDASERPGGKPAARPLDWLTDKGRLVHPPVHLRTRKAPEPSLHAIILCAGDTQTCPEGTACRFAHSITDRLGCRAICPVRTVLRRPVAGGWKSGLSIFCLLLLRIPRLKLDIGPSPRVQFIDQQLL